MEAGTTTDRPPRAAGGSRVWLFGLLPIALLAVGLVAILSLGAPGLGERPGPPAEELAVERTVLRPGEIELTVRNEGADSVEVAHVAVNDAYVSFRSDSRTIGRLGSEKLIVTYPWVEGEAYEIFLLTSTGGTVDHAIDVAVETPAAGIGFYGLMALLGTYVGIIPVLLGMLWLPFVRRIGPKLLRGLMALTIGLLVFLGIDATLEGLELAGEGGRAFGGATLVFLGAIAAYLALKAIDSHMRGREQRARSAGATGTYVALIVAIGIGLHNLGEGLAIGAAYAGGALALGALLVIGFALHNTTEGLAIVAPVAARRPSLARLVALGLVAGAPAVLGAWIGATAFNASITALLLGVGVGAIIQVVELLVPLTRDATGRLLHAGAVAGIAAGVAIMYFTGLLVSV